MKTIFLTTSPKKHKKWANSTYFLWLTRLFFFGRDVVCLDLGGKKDYDKILRECSDADTVVMAMPVYVDAIPSHILAFLQVAQAAAIQSNWHCKVYTVANCGFFEGIQCEFLLKQVECWCHRARLEYGGGLGIGAGEMLGILRLTNVAFAAVMVTVQLIVGIASTFIGNIPLFPNVFNHIDWISLGINIGIFFLYSLGLYINTFKLAQSLRRRETIQNRYTTVWFCGRWIFMLFGSLFWIIRAALYAVPIWKMFCKIPKET